ncbi:MAG: RlmE family RNA methyltransferase [Immundisolibacter sp.]|uniref:RlmE family RNA methyltransferase n=1 Tax=Immundisolibacter sp. TaxID=1934948 RepID=UPI003EE1DBE9
MSGRGSSRRWLDQHFADPYVRQAQAQGYRSRASFKLLEINKRDHLLQPGATVVDLGAAPGGWSQVAAVVVGARGRVVALDVLAMPSLPGVEFTQGDFTDDAVLEQLLAGLPGGADLVMSDMAPNLSGVRDVDQAATLYLAELALDFAARVLKPRGMLLVKSFEGAGSQELRALFAQRFAQVLIRKPDASRDRSREHYLIGRGKLP